MEQGAGDDPFDGVEFDERFIEAAPVSEAERDAKAARRAREEALLARLQEEEKRSSRQRGVARRSRLRHPWRSIPVKVRAGMVIALVVVVLVVTNSGVLGGSSERQWASGDPFFGTVLDGNENRPTPTGAPYTEPPGTPAPVPPGGGSHEFLGTQEGTDDPVAYDPCRPIGVVVNLGDRPPTGALSLVTDAVAEMAGLTGLQMTIEGTTDEPAVFAREAFQPDRYGDRWAPVLVAWSNPSLEPELQDFAGIGGSAAVESEPGGPLVLVTGAVILNSPAFEEMLTYDDGYNIAKSIVLHELGHLVGLDHTFDESQLMSPQGDASVLGPQAGDLEGLAKLGRGPCFDKL